MTYMQQRYYDPAIGRMLSVDPAHAGFNLYNYANNNPYRFTDPDGRVPQGCERNNSCPKPKKPPPPPPQPKPSSKPLNDSCDQCTLIHPADGSSPYYVPRVVAGQSLTATITPGASISPPPGVTTKRVVVGLGIVAVSATGVGLRADAVGAVAVAETSSDVAITSGVGAAALDHSKATGVAVDIGLRVLGNLTGLGPVLDMTLGAMKWGHDLAETADEATEDQHQ